MARRFALLLVPACARADPKEVHKKHLQKLLSKHGFESEAVQTMVDAWAAEEQDHPRV